MELNLNDKQQEAVGHIDGPLLILAGAGSGKTRVLTHRIAHMIKDEHINPWNILAITFTNKAANEMRERVDDTTDNMGSAVWVSTFHSLCVRILHRHIERLGYDSNFTIYDTDDQKQLLKNIIKKLDLDSKTWKERMFVGKISHAKERMISAKQYMDENSSNFKEKIVAQVFMEYEKEMKKNNALDFDDLLCKTVELFRNNEDVLKSYQDRFKYIMVDEYQDTNMVQFYLVEMLAKEHKNICVVGDDDQSIYAFRGADIRNILNFEKYFPGAKVIKLEENYRSTAEILNAANGVIANNKGRKAKTLWTKKTGGELVKFKKFNTGYDEASFVAFDIEKKLRTSNCSYKDFAVLYRTNAQSRLIEEKLISRNIPYRLVGGVNFYSRKEIKDILAYLKTIDNGNDEIALRRIINTPKRGIGNTTVDRVVAFANNEEISLLEAMEHVDHISSISRGANKVKEFVELILELKEDLKKGMSVTEILDDVLEKTGYISELKLENTDEAKARIENIDELRNKAVDYDRDTQKDEQEKSLGNFLEDVALVADIDSMEDSDNRVTLMTLHGSKGLEFPDVYITGMEEGMFPSYMSITSENEADIEEERRLCYVGITRAKERLTLCYASTRMVHGETRFSEVSRFISEIPPELLEEDGESESIFTKSSSNDYGNKRSFGSGVGSSYSGSYSSGFSKNSSYAGKDESYIKRREDFRKTMQPINLEAMKGKSIVVDTQDGLDYEVGDRVSHIKFGEGTVQNIEEGARDYKVTVDFDSGETRSMFAAFAKLSKI